MLRVACLGNLTLDHLLFVDTLPQLDDVALVRLRDRAVGGRGAIVARLLGVLGVPTCLVTVVGNSLEQWAYDQLSNSQVDTSAIAVAQVNETTSEVVIVIGEKEQNSVSYFIQKPIPFEPTDDQQKCVRAADILYFTTHNYSFNLRFLTPDFCKDKKVIHNFSAHMTKTPEYVERLLLTSHILITNSDDLPALLNFTGGRDAGSLMSRWGTLAGVVVTRSRKDAVVWETGRITEVPSQTINVAVPVGLGDSFAAGVVLALARRESLVKGTNYGSLLAAQSARYGYYGAVRKNLNQIVART